jgi:DUF1365 family protein
MKSKIFWGEVTHWRAAPKEHFFRYPIFTLGIEVDELAQLAVAPRLLVGNRRGVFSVWEDDYLRGDGREGVDLSAPTLRERVESVCQAAGCTEKIAGITLLTMPRMFGYVFNPVSFFLCHTATGQLVGCITEVSNTFGDAHLYPLVCAPCDPPYTWRFSKDLFVSPFFAREGEYALTVEAVGAVFGVRVELRKDGERLFSARLHGTGDPVSRTRLCATLVRYPLTVLLTMTRIHLQALRLYRRVGARVYERPETVLPGTIRSGQRWIHRMRLRLLGWLRRRAS